MRTWALLVAIFIGIPGAVSCAHAPQQKPEVRVIIVKPPPEPPRRLPCFECTPIVRDI